MDRNIETMLTVQVAPVFHPLRQWQQEESPGRQQEP